MMSPYEAIGFEKCVLVTFDNKEFVENWEKLRGIKLSGDVAMRLFIEDIRELVWDKLDAETRLILCTT